MVDGVAVLAVAATVFSVGVFNLIEKSNPLSAASWSRLVVSLVVMGMSVDEGEGGGGGAALLLIIKPF